MSHRRDAIRDLDRLLANLSPRLDADTFVFTSHRGARYGDLASLQPVATVQETEGLTLVLRAADATAAGIASEPEFRRITLCVHSDLEAVGLTAAVSGALAEANIPANLLAGAYHDHLFVPVAQAEAAMAVLNALADRAGR